MITNLSFVSIQGCWKSKKIKNISKEINLQFASVINIQLAGKSFWAHFPRKKILTHIFYTLSIHVLNFLMGIWVFGGFLGLFRAFLFIQINLHIFEKIWQRCSSLLSNYLRSWWCYGQGWASNVTFCHSATAYIVVTKSTCTTILYRHTTP